MQLNQHRDEMESHRNNTTLPSDHWFDRFLADIGCPALLALLFGLMVALTTSCTSTGGGVKAGLIAPVMNVSQSSTDEDGGFYQPRRSPGFNELSGS